MLDRYVEGVSFDALHEALNTGGRTRVAEGMSKWHPAILGQMLEAVALAKEKRYRGEHSDFTAGVRRVEQAIGS